MLTTVECCAGCSKWGAVACHVSCSCPAVCRQVCCHCLLPCLQAVDYTNTELSCCDTGHPALSCSSVRLIMSAGCIRNALPLTHALSPAFDCCVFLCNCNGTVWLQIYCMSLGRRVSLGSPHTGGSAAVEGRTCSCEPLLHPVHVLQ